MSGNLTGTLFRVLTFGESHGPCVGGVIEGCPSNIKLDMQAIHNDLQRRKPSGFFETTRIEEEKIHFLSGIFEEKTLGTPIAFIIENSNTRSIDYDLLKQAFRPSHADYTYQIKYGIRDYRGGGRASARETVARIVAGSIAKQILNQYNIHIIAYTSQIGSCVLEKDYRQLNLSNIESSPLRCPDRVMEEQMEIYLKYVKENKDTAGGVITCVIMGCPPGLGEPVFDKLHADLAKAVLSIPSAKGFEYGQGFKAASMLGSQCLDAFNEDFSTQFNYSGGIQGGISNGQDILFKVAFKPIASLSRPIPITNQNGETELQQLFGRHDICQVPRTVPIVEAMAALVIADKLLCRQAVTNKNEENK